MCTNGGSYHYYNYNTASWEPVNVPQGMLVSATALSSFAGRITVTDI